MKQFELLDAFVQRVQEVWDFQDLLHADDDTVSCNEFQVLTERLMSSIPGSICDDIEPVETQFAKNDQYKRHM